MEIIDRYRQSKAKRQRVEVEEAAATLYQIQEFGGELWLTFGGSLVCPCSMLTEEPVAAVRKMRELYVERHE